MFAAPSGRKRTTPPCRKPGCCAMATSRAEARPPVRCPPRWPCLQRKRSPHPIRDNAERLPQFVGCPPARLLWTAYCLKLADPSLRIVVLEARFAGFGASGRNGGWSVTARARGNLSHCAGWVCAECIWPTRLPTGTKLEVGPARLRSPSSRTRLPDDRISRLRRAP